MRIKSAIAIGIGTAVGVTCALLVPYLLITPGSLSSVGDWGQFGDYVGGVLGTAFTALAFIGVVITLALQRTQLVELQAQAHEAKLDSSRAELQRATGSVVEHIEKLLDSPFIGGKFLSLRDAVNYRCYATINDISVDEIDGDNKRWLFDGPGLHEINARVERIRLEFEQMKWCVEQYLSQGGSALVASFYRRRFLTLYMELVEAHFFDPSGDLSIFFTGGS